MLELLVMLVVAVSMHRSVTRIHATPQKSQPADCFISVLDASEHHPARSVCQHDDGGNYQSLAELPS